MIGGIEETSASSKPDPRLDPTRQRGARGNSRPYRDPLHLDRLSLGLDVRKLHPFSPFRCFVSYELAKLGGRVPNRNAAKLGEPCFYHRLRKGRVDLIIELIDDLDRRSLGRSEAMPGTRLITWHE